MKILFLALGIFRPEGGIERFNQRVLRVLSETIEESKSVSLSVISLRDQTAQPPPIEYIHFKGYSSKKLGAFFGFLKELIIQKPNLFLYGHILFTPIAFVTKLLFPNSKSILFIHGIEAWKKPKIIPHWFYRFSYDRILSVSDYSAKTMSESFHISRNKFYIIGNSIDITIQDSMIEKKNKLTSKPIIVSVSRLSKQSKHKNIDKVICSLPTILNEYPNLKYYIIGEGDWRPEIQTLVNGLNLQNVVEFFGAINDEEKYQILRRSNLFVLPSTKEGFGIVFLEAWASDLPIIASNSGAATEIIDNGIDGLCVEPIPSKISNAVLFLLKNPKIMIQMAVKGKAKVINYFSYEIFATKLLEYLNIAK